MKKFFSLSLASIAVILCGIGCTNVETNRVGNQVQISMPVVVQPTIETKDQVISGSATVHSILGIFSWGARNQAVGVNYFGYDLNQTGGALGDLLSFASKSEIVARNAAAYKATSEAKADIILAPQYVLTTKDYFFYKSINCNVKGFPGFVKSVKVVDR